MVFMEWRLYMREVVVVSRQDVPTVQASCLCNLYIVETATGQQIVSPHSVTGCIKFVNTYKCFFVFF